ncbi:DNA primase [Nanoarchaeota archaeon]
MGWQDSLSTETIANIRSLNISWIIDNFVPGHKMVQTEGAYTGPCPIHKGKKTEFAARNNYFTCFKCGEKGDGIDFVQALKSIDGLNAAKLISKAADIPFETATSEHDALTRELMYQIHEDSAEYYRKNLSVSSKDKKDALDYLLSRVSEQSIREWGLGFAPRMGLSSFLIEKGHDADLVSRLGLRVKSEDRGNWYDFFRNRIMFPIKNERGKVVGFAGRDIEKDPRIKYMNSRESEIYRKSECLFGIDKAIRDIRIKKQVIVMEGYMDVIAAHENGIENCVAVAGTALNYGLIRTLSRYARDITLCFDPDAAGWTATERIGKTALSEKVAINIVDLGHGDPDEFLKEYGKKKFLSAIKNGVNPIEFILERKGLKKIKGIDNRCLAVRDLYPVIDSTTDPAQKSAWLEYIAKELKINSRALNKSYNLHVRELAGYQNGRPIEQYFLGFLTSNTTHRMRAKEKFIRENFSRPEYGLYFEFLCFDEEAKDVVYNPDLQMDENSLFTKVQLSDLLDKFKSYCKERKIILRQTQLGNLEGMLLSSTNEISDFVRQMEMQVLADKLEYKKGLIKKLERESADHSLIPNLVVEYNKLHSKYESLKHYINQGV